MSNHYANTVFLGRPKPADMDNHAHAVEEDGDMFTHCTFDANGASEALKASRKWGVTIAGGKSIGGVEDCHDYVRGGDLLVEAHHFDRGRAKQDVTIKGGFRGAHFKRCTGLLLIEAGNYTKYDARAIYPDGREARALPWRCARPPMRGGHVSVAPEAGRAVVRLFHSEPWTGDVINRPLAPWWPAHRLLVSLYFWARATFFKEAHPAPAAEFNILPGEL